MTINNLFAQASLKLLAQKTLDFPSASGLEFYKNKLYVFGDNATHLLLLSTDYNVVDSVPYWKGGEAVIDKEDKPDIESAMIVEKNSHPVLYGVGSMSDKKRWRVFAFSLDSLRPQATVFFERNKAIKNIEELNIEGSTSVGNAAVFCNRANQKTKRNYLLFWNWKDSIAAKEILLPKTRLAAGMSGLCYVKEKDLLLFTASEEATGNAVQDGAIGDSYLGWITAFSKKTTQPSFSPDGYLKLSRFDKSFAKQKVESVAVEKAEGEKLTLHLVADNDDNQSKIFKVELQP